MSRIFCIVGKSSSGKDTLYRGILAQSPELIPVVPYTTRPRRVTERDGVDYWFVTDAQLEQLEREGRVIEKRCYQTIQGPWNYFTVRFEPDERRDRIMITTLEGAKALMAHYGADAVHVVYLQADDKTLLLRYIERETLQEKPDFAEVCRRFLTDRADFAEEKLSVFPNLYRIDANQSPEACLKSWERIYNTL